MQKKKKKKPVRTHCNLHTEDCRLWLSASTKSKKCFPEHLYSPKLFIYLAYHNPTVFCICNLTTNLQSSVHFNTKFVAVSGQSKPLCIYTHQDPLKHSLGLVFNYVAQGAVDLGLGKLKGASFLCDMPISKPRPLIINTLY